MDPKRQEITDRLNQVFQEVFDNDELQIFDEMTAKDVEEWDSVEHISLVIATEQEFGFRLNAAEVVHLANVGDMIDLLMERATK